MYIMPNLSLYVLSMFVRNVYSPEVVPEPARQTETGGGGGGERVCVCVCEREIWMGVMCDL